MRTVLAQVDPAVGDVAQNLVTVSQVVRKHPADLYVFPELFLSAYRIGDAFHTLAISAGDPTCRTLADLASEHRAVIATGAPVRHARAGEIENATLVAAPGAGVTIRSKRFLPTYGPFEEGSTFSPGSGSEPILTKLGSLGFQICFDAFFPEVSRDLALGGAGLLVILSAAPVTSRVLFDRVLPARAVENALPLVYVNRVGVEDGIVFGGGSMALDARGSVLVAADPADRGRVQILETSIDLAEAGRWRPFRPVLRDIARPSAVGS